MDHTLYYAAIEADEAWSRELRRLFKGQAGDVRYTHAGKGAPGSELRKLHDAFQEASEAWRAEMGRARSAS